MMINYFNIPTQAQISTPISKTLFADKGDISGVDKRMLRENVASITMRGLFQTRTIGLASYIDSEYQYDQLVIAEVVINNATKVEKVATMIQQAFPMPIILVISINSESYSINWCVKRINQADNSKRVIEDMQQTRIFSLNDTIAKEWIKTLDVTKLKCDTIKDRYDQLSEKLIMLKVSDEAGVWVSNSNLTIEEYRLTFEKLNTTREEQKQIMQQLKTEIQLSNQIKLNSKLKELQNIEKSIKAKLK